MSGDDKVSFFAHAVFFRYVRGRTSRGYRYSGCTYSPGMHIFYRQVRFLMPFSCETPLTWLLQTPVLIKKPQRLVIFLCGLKII
jgi:hypothetical protein